MECYFQSTEPIALPVVLSHSPIPMLETCSVTLLLSPSTTISMGWLLPVFTTAVTADAVTQRDMECYAPVNENIGMAIIDTPLRPSMLALMTPSAPTVRAT